VARRFYFPVLSLTLLALSLVAFGDNLFTDVHQPSNSDPKFVIHGIASLGWILVLLTQSLLVCRRQIGWHRRLGSTGFLMAGALALSTLWLFVAVWKGWDAMAPNIRANRLFLAAFVALVLLAYFNRHRPDRHKRLLFGATLLLLEPVLARCFDPLVADPFMGSLTEPQIEAAFLPVLFTTWVALFASLLLYDLIVERRIHPASVLAPGLFVAIWALLLL
jgi:hypothetical protein